MNHRLKLSLSAGFIIIGVAMTAVAVADAAAVHPGKILYSFSGGYSGGPDGAFPVGDLILDATGVYYGNTSGGGGSTNCSLGCGTVYKVVDGEESVIYSFNGGTDGSYPVRGLHLDADGNLYGATGGGGDYDLGTVFKVTPGGSKTTLHSFAGGIDDGEGPNGDLIADADGTLYGTTVSGGVGNCDGGCGTVFKLTPEGEESVLYMFTGGPGLEGANPAAGLIMGPDGNFYGTTYGGGRKTNCGPDGCGTIFKLSPDGHVTVIHAFEGGTSAGHPTDRLFLDADGNFYGTTYNGGVRNQGCVFKVQPDGTERVVYSFKGHADGKAPAAGLIADAEGTLYGNVTFGGEDISGEVYRVTPAGQFATLYTFPGTFNGNFPSGRLIFDRQGKLIGTTARGGDHDAGIIFAVQN
jgi:uncharacterized repeat protein (TIGR03803 family)